MRCGGLRRDDDAVPERQDLQLSIRRRRDGGNVAAPHVSNGSDIEALLDKEEA